MARKVERIDAKRLYTEELKEVPEISKQLNVPEKTIYRWKSDDLKKGSDWDKEREAIRNTLSSVSIKTDQVAAAQYEKILKEIAATGKINPAEIYAFRQLLLSAEAFKKKQDKLGDILLMVNELIEFMTENHPDRLESLHDLLTEFGDSMRDKYGKK